MFKRYIEIDTAPYEVPDDEAAARYGLPQQVRFCAKCGISNQRPNAARSEFTLVADSEKKSHPLRRGRRLRCLQLLGGKAPNDRLGRARKGTAGHL